MSKEVNYLNHQVNVGMGKNYLKDSNELSAHHVKKNVIHLFDLKMKLFDSKRMIVVTIKLNWDLLPLTSNFLCETFVVGGQLQKAVVLI